MGMELDLLNHDVVKQLVIEAYELGHKNAGGSEGSLPENNEAILQELREIHTESEDTED